jgi:ribokinase
MILVVGLPAYVAAAGDGGAGGLAVDIARSAVAGGAEVQLVGKIGDDGAGDAVVVALGRLGIGHAALLRDPVHPTPVLTLREAVSGDAGGADGDAGVAAAAGDADEEEAAPATLLLPADAAARPALDGGDVALALGYLEGAKVVVAEPLPAAALASLVEGAAFSGAALIVLVESGAPVPVLPAEATILEAPVADDGSFGRLVGDYAAGLDRGRAPEEAFEAAVGSSGWETSAE